MFNSISLGRVNATFLPCAVLCMAGLEYANLLALSFGLMLWFILRQYSDNNDIIYDSKSNDSDFNKKCMCSLVIMNICSVMYHYISLTTTIIVTCMIICFAIYIYKEILKFSNSFILTTVEIGSLMILILLLHNAIISNDPHMIFFITLVSTYTLVIFTVANIMYFEDNMNRHLSILIQFMLMAYGIICELDIEHYRNLLSIPVLISVVILVIDMCIGRWNKG